MKVSIFVVVIAATSAVLGACSEHRTDTSRLDSAGAPLGAFRGYESVSSILRQRLLDPDDAATGRFELGVFLGTRDPLGLPALFGGFSGDGPDLAYRNGVPNAMNVAAWYLVAQRLTDQLAKSCATPAVKLNDTYALAPEIKDSLQSLCAWPETSDDELARFFDDMMGAFAPPSEKERWLAFLTSLRDMPPGVATGASVVKTASATIFLHPNFLLQN